MERKDTVNTDYRFTVIKKFLTSGQFEVVKRKCIERNAGTLGLLDRNEHLIQLKSNQSIESGTITLVHEFFHYLDPEKKEEQIEAESIAFYGRLRPSQIGFLEFIVSTS